MILALYRHPDSYNILDSSFAFDLAAKTLITHGTMRFVYAFFQDEIDELLDGEANLELTPETEENPLDTLLKNTLIFN